MKWLAAHKGLLAGLFTAASLYLTGHTTEALAAVAGVISGGFKGPSGS